MAIKGEISRVPGVIRALDESKFEFHATGSRFFGTARENSDYDYFTELVDGVGGFLMDMGFRLPEEAHEYGSIVYRYQDSNVRVDVQVYDGEEFRIRRELHQMFYLYPNLLKAFSELYYHPHTCLNLSAKRSLWSLMKEFFVYAEQYQASDGWEMKQ